MKSKNDLRPLKKQTKNKNQNFWYLKIIDAKTHMIITKIII